jgi:hypothetical protein
MLAHRSGSTRDRKAKRFGGRRQGAGAKSGKIGGEDPAAWDSDKI